MALSSRFFTSKALVLGLLSLLLIVPFNLASRFPPYQSFYQDTIVVLLMLMLFLTLLTERRIIAALPRGTVYLFILAAYWFVQPLIVNVPYSEQNIRVGLLFVLLGMLVWSVQGLLLQHGREMVVAWAAWALLIGVGFQSVVLLLQFSGLADWVKWFVVSDGTNVSGQFGQRNMLGHYIMWGVLAAAYLTGKERISVGWGITFIILFGGCLSLVSSRTIVAYVIAVLLLLFFLRVFLHSNNKVTKALFFAVCWVLLAQWLVPPVLSVLGIEAQSGLERLVEQPDAQYRIPEWRKAWHSFLQAPLFGHGWHNYGYQSFLTDWVLIPDTNYHINGYFSHSHNIILQILAEMGISGATLVFGGLLWVIAPMLKQLNQSYFILIFTLLAVSACHSLLEYPLWYSYFLTAFVIFLSLGQPAEKLVAYPKVSGYSRLLLLISSGFGLLAVIGVLGFNQWLIQKSLKAFPNFVHVNHIRVRATFELGQNIPLLTPYGDMGRIENLNIAKNDLLPQDAALIERFSHYSPIYYVVNLQGLSLYRQGKKAESIEWMKKVWHYYPRQIPKSIMSIYQASPMFKELEVPVYEACLRQKELAIYKVFKEAQGCPKPPSLKGVKNQISDHSLTERMPTNGEK